MPVVLAHEVRTSGETRHAAALAWTGTVGLALNTSRLGGAEHDLPVVAPCSQRACAAAPHADEQLAR